MLDIDIIHKTSQEIIDMCQEPDTALMAMAHWVQHQSIEAEAVESISQRICADMDVQSAYYLVRILQAMPESERPIDLQPLMELVTDFGDELNDTVADVVTQDMLAKLGQEADGAS